MTELLLSKKKKLSYMIRATTKENEVQTDRSTGEAFSTDRMAESTLATGKTTKRMVKDGWFRTTEMSTKGTG